MLVLGLRRREKRKMKKKKSSCHLDGEFPERTCWGSQRVRGG